MTLVTRAPQAMAARLDRVAIMTLNFENMMRVHGLWEGPTDTLELFDIPEMYADRYGVHNIEIQHTHFASTEPAYLRDLRARVEKSKSRFTNINLEFGPLTVSAPQPTARRHAIDLTKQWIDHAAAVGSPRVMINQGAPTHESKAWSVPALKEMVAYGASKGVKVGIETRGPVSGNNRGVVNPAAQPPATPPPTPPPAPAPGAPLPVLTAVPGWVLLSEILHDSGALANVDLGGVGAADQGELHAALRTLLPVTVGSMHVRPSPRWDLATAIRFTVTLGYQGIYSIEVRGHDGTRAALDTVLANI